MHSKVVDDGSPDRRRFNYNDYMQNLEQKLEDSKQRQSTYVARVPAVVDPLSIGQSPGAAIYDQLDQQQKKNVEFKDKVLARLGNIEDSKDDSGSGANNAGLMGEGGMHGDDDFDEMDNMDDIDVQMQGFQEGLEGETSEEDDAMMGARGHADALGQAHGLGAGIASQINEESSESPNQYRQRRALEQRLGGQPM